MKEFLMTIMAVLAAVTMTPAQSMQDQILQGRTSGPGWRVIPDHLAAEHGDYPQFAYRGSRVFDSSRNGHPVIEEIDVSGHFHVYWKTIIKLTKDCYVSKRLEDAKIAAQAVDDKDWPIISDMDAERRLGWLPKGDLCGVRMITESGQWYLVHPLGDRDYMYWVRADYVVTIQFKLDSKGK